MKIIQLRNKEDIMDLVTKGESVFVIGKNVNKEYSLWDVKTFTLKKFLDALDDNNVVFCIFEKDQPKSKEGDIDD